MVCCFAALLLCCVVSLGWDEGRKEEGGTGMWGRCRAKLLRRGDKLSCQKGWRRVLCRERCMHVKASA